MPDFERRANLRLFSPVRFARNIQLNYIVVVWAEGLLMRVYGFGLWFIGLWFIGLWFMVYGLWFIGLWFIGLWFRSVMCNLRYKPINL